MAQAALMAALLAVLSQLAIPLQLVPINLGLLAVLLIGLVLPPRQAMQAVGLYLLMGALGLPVFAGARGGPQALFGPTGGYLLGYFLAAAAISLPGERAHGFAARLSLCALGLLCCYIPGALYLAFLTGRAIPDVLSLAVLPFLPGDLLKALLAAGLSPRLRRALASRGA